MQIRYRELWRPRIGTVESSNGVPAKLTDDGSNLCEALLIVLHAVVRHTADLTMDLRTSEFFIANLFADSGFDQMGAGKKHAPGFVDNHRFVAHDRKIRTAGHAGPHDGRNLRDSQR